MKLKLIIAGILTVLALSNAHAQVYESRVEGLRLRLENVADDVPGLHNKVSFSISGVSLYEFLRALAVKNKLNLDVDPSLKTNIAVNFSDVTVNDLLVYLCEQYELEVLTNGNIISIFKYAPPVPEPVSKPLKINFGPDHNLLSYDLSNDTLGSVAKKITELSKVNIVLPHRLQNNLVSGYIKELPIAKAVQELAFMNNLSFTIKDSLTYYLEDQQAKTSKKADESLNANLPKGLRFVSNKRDSIISIYAHDVPIKEVLSVVAKDLNINYFIFTDLKGNADLKLENIDFSGFLKYLLNATQYTFKLQNDVYLIGDRTQEEIRTAEVYPLQYRTVTDLPDHIPSELKKNLEIIAIDAINSLVIAGSSPAVQELRDFLRQIDKVVPVVNIELIIMDIRKSNSLSTGIMAGVDNTVTTSYSSLFPALDVTLNANTINSILSGINGTGLVNLGNVTPGFYVSLKASEDNGHLKIRSTPRLATLNGKEAKMTIGETRYYAEQTTNVITTQSTTTVTGRIFKELQANFSVTIKPIVSGDEQITLDITVEQSTFTEQFTKDGPYGRLTRSFKSSLRVKNNDMILLGGLQERSSDNAGQGVPFLSRIPVLKWFFSSRSQSNKKSKLAILIHPTVFY